MDGQSREFLLELNENCEQLVSSSEDQVSPDALHMEGNFPMTVDFGISKDYALDIPKPKLGMVFQSDGEAYEYYNRYARSLGFNVRKTSTTLRANGTISRRIFCCSKEGFRRTHPRGPSMKARPPTRIDCKARLVTKLQADGQYCVIEFVKEHNHELEPPSEAHPLSLQQNIQGSEAAVMNNMHSSVTRPNGRHAHMSDEFGRPNAVLEQGDAQFLLDYLQRTQKQNPYFFYSFRMGADNQLGCCFWCDAKSVIDYSLFGDAVCFDTSYKTNTYEKPYAPFIGVNNHGQFIFFGCALLLDETMDTLAWLFQTFLTAMNRKQPKLIFTDQTMPMGNAIRQVFPHAHHRFCMWHIYQDAIKHLSDAFEKSSSFVEDFKSCIYDKETEEEFQTGWDALLENNNLVENQWLQGLYELREKWAQAYGRDHFCVGLTTVQRSEDMNKFLKKYLKRFLPLRDFVSQYEKAVAGQREKENKQNSISTQTKPDLRTMWPAEAQAAERYTRKIFMLFQDEYVGTLDLFVEITREDGPLYTYMVSSFRSTRPHTVTFDASDSTTKCSCKRFESMGILCAHALKVLHNRRLLDLPSQYYLNRWTKDVRPGVVVGDHDGKQMHIDDPSFFEARHSELVHMALTLAVRAASTEKSSAFVKLILTRVLGEVDNILKTESESTSHVNVVEETAANHTAANHESVDKQSVGVEGVTETSRSEKRHPRLKGSQVSLGRTVSRPPIAVGMPGLPLSQAMPWGMPQYTQAAKQAMLPQSGTNIAPGLVSSAPPSWHGEIFPVKVVEGPRTSSLQGLTFCPTGVLNVPPLPCTYPNIYTEESTKPSEGETSNRVSSTTQSSEEAFRIENSHEQISWQGFAPPKVQLVAMERGHPFSSPLTCKNMKA